MKRDRWESATMLAKTRPNRLPDRVGPSDLLYPTGPRTPSMFLLCGVGGFVLSLTLVFGPLVVFAAFTPVVVPAAWLLLVGAAGWAAFWLGLFVAATREDAELRRWLADQ